MKYLDKDTLPRGTRVRMSTTHPDVPLGAEGRVTAHEGRYCTVVTWDPDPDVADGPVRRTKFFMARTALTVV